MKETTKNRIRLIFNIFILIFNGISIILLLSSYLASFINPEKTTLFALIGLGYPYLVLANIIFILFWALRKSWFFLGSFICIIAASGMFVKYFQIFPHHRTIPENAIKVMTYNVRNFDVYNFITNQLGFENRNKILATIQQEQPDIICFQEFYFDSLHNFKTYDTLLELLPPMNMHINYTAINRRIAHFGQAIFTRFPILKKERIRFKTSKDNSCIYSDILIDKDTVRVYNMHLASIGFGKEDYGIKDLFHDIENVTDNPKMKKNIVNVLVQLKKAFIRRVSESAMVAESIASSPYPVIVCGDFNDTPISYAFRTIQKSKDLLDSFTESGWGFAQTYAGPFPAMRIDHILHSSFFDSFGYKVINNEGSDHYPVVTHLVKAENE